FAITLYLDSGYAAMFNLQPTCLALTPDFSAVPLDGICQIVPQPYGTPRAKTETLECAFDGEVGQKRAGRQFISIDGKNGCTEVAENGMHLLVLGVLGKPFRRRHARLRQVTTTGVGKLRPDFCGLFGEGSQQQPPTAAL